MSMTGAAGRRTQRQTLNIKNLDDILDEAQNDQDPDFDQDNEDMGMGGRIGNYDGEDLGLDMENTLDAALQSLEHEDNTLSRESRRNVEQVRRNPTMQSKSKAFEEPKDILDQIMTEEQEDDDRFEMNMQAINTRQQLQSVIVRPGQDFEKSLNMNKGDEVLTFQGQISPETSMKDFRGGSMYGQTRGTNQARFSMAFGDREVKNSLVHAHSQQRKAMLAEIQQDSEGQTSVGGRIHGAIEQESDENSLGTEEDLDHYLAELEEEEQRRKQEAQEMLQLQKELLGDEEVDKGFKLSAKYKFEKKKEDKRVSEESKEEEVENYAIRETGKDLFDVINEIEEVNEDEFDSDDSITKQYYQTMHQEVLMLGMSDKQIANKEKQGEMFKDDWEMKDMIKIIDWNERRYQEIAKKTLKENSVLSQKNAIGSKVRTKVMSNFTNLNVITARLNKEKQYSQAKATCLGLSEDLLFVGSSEGHVLMFDRENEEDYATFTEKNKEFLGNAVTAIDIHPNKTEYVVIGYERGQLVLFDCTDPKKSIKVIKDHHKNTQIVNIKFCDWNGFSKNKDQEKELSQPSTPIGGQAPIEDVQAWMFISIDRTGKVIVNSVYKQLFMLKASKHIIIDPASSAAPEYSELSCRFKSQFHGQGVYDDLPMVAIGNNQDVKILEVRHNAHYEISQINKPTKFFNRQKNALEDFRPKSPSLSWGHGHSPVLKDRPHCLLAIAWGPLVQLVVLIDHEETSQPFIQDGFHILRNIVMAESRLFVNPKLVMSKSDISYPDFIQRDESSKTRDFSGGEITLRSLKTTTAQTMEEESKGEDLVIDDVLLYDESNAFKWPEYFIEQIQFISDSTLMVITQNQEIRILHTAAFNPEVYKPATLQVLALKGQSLCSIDQVNRCELEQGFKLPNVVKSVYHQTLKFFQSKLVVLTEKNIQVSQHLSWQTALYDFKREVQDDLILVFQRALDIYKGKIKGYAGIPDSNAVREISLKADLKLLIRDIICQVIEKTQETNAKQKSQTYDRAQPIIDSGSNSKEYIQQTLNKLAEFEEERSKKYQTLIRISIEFCVELKDCYFLFYDLFLLFQEEKLEDLFIKELEPFIMAGKFQEWELPNEVLQSHVIKYYKNDPNKSDSLEKIIVNLNFNQCPKTIVLEFIHFSEQNFLTTALLFLYTQVIEKKDNTSCVQVLCSLFDLYKKSSKKNNVSMIDLHMLREFEYEAEEKKQIEKSQIYLGYKILWIIRLFIDGKKFPQGNIREKKWRSYIHDVIEFLSTPDYLRVLLEVDAETFFRVISILFYQSKPFDLVEQGRDDINNPSLRSQTHLEFLKQLDDTCLQEKNSEHIKYQYLFFVANVVAKSSIQGIEQTYFYKITKELLSKHRRYLEFNKGLQDLTNKKRRRIQEHWEKEGKPEKAERMRQIEELKYISKTEADFLNLFRKSEPLDTQRIQELLKLCEFTQFNQLKIYLLEKKEEYIRCLQLLLSDNQISEGLTEEQHSERVLAWIREKLYILEERSQRSVIEKNMYEQFKREVTQNVKKMVQMSAKETIRLVEEKLGGNHKELVDVLSRDPIEQMMYLETLLEEKELVIAETIKNYGLQSANPQEAKKYLEFLKQHLRLCCQHKKDKVLKIVERMVKNTYYPIQDCLTICQEYQQQEAAFLLNKKLGKYFDAVKLGIEIMKTKVDLRKLKVELYFALKKEISINFPVQQDFMHEASQFDSIFKQILKICRKNSKEVEHDKEELVWYIVIDTMMELKAHDQVATKSFCRVFFQKRLNLFMESLVRVIPFSNFLSYVLGKQKDLRFREFQELIMTIFANVHSENVVISNANNAIFKVNTDLFSQVSLQTRRGILFRNRTCTICKRYIDTFLYDDAEDIDTGVDSESDDEFSGTPYVYNAQEEPLKIFACKHSFHIRCLQKYYKQKTNEVYDVFLKRTEKLRCPTCNLKNFEIESEGGAKGQGSAQRKKPEQMAAYKANHEYLMMQNMTATRQSTNQSIYIPSQVEGEEQMSRKEQLRQIRQTMKSVNLVNKKLQKLSKSMEFFEEQYDSQAMNINDFKKIR